MTPSISKRKSRYGLIAVRPPPALRARPLPAENRLVSVAPPSAALPLACCPLPRCAAHAGLHDRHAAEHRGDFRHDAVAVPAPAERRGEAAPRVGGFDAAAHREVAPTAPGAGSAPSH